jgi:glucosamine-6-phosphate deaminase
MLERQVDNRNAETYDGLKIYKPEVIVFPTPEEVDIFAAGIVTEQIHSKPDSVLTLPTGSTPIGMYRLIVEAYNKGLDMSKLTTTNLDEYYPISRSYPESYYAFMKRHLIDKVNISEGSWFIPNGEADDPDEEANRYQNILHQVGTRDLTVLGLGPDLTCHIGFNRPGSDFYSRTRYIRLDDETKNANSINFDNNPDKVSEGAITMGVADIMDSKLVLMIVKGLHKAPGLKRTLEGEIGPDAPASFLRFHPNVTFILDREAGSLLENNGS